MMVEELALEMFSRPVIPVNQTNLLQEKQKMGSMKGLMKYTHQIRLKKAINTLVAFSTGAGGLKSNKLASTFLELDFAMSFSSSSIGIFTPFYNSNKNLLF
jgi:hypothetical protein